MILRTPAAATELITSFHRPLRGESDIASVPENLKCSILAPNGDAGRRRAVLDDETSANAFARSRSVLSGRCGPCCSMDPSGKSATRGGDADSIAVVWSPQLCDGEAVPEQDAAFLDSVSAVITGKPVRKRRRIVRLGNAILLMMLLSIVPALLRSSHVRTLPCAGSAVWT
jgi:hypothetical protein